MDNIMDFMSTALRGDALSRLETAVPASVAALAAYGSSSGKAEELLGAIRLDEVQFAPGSTALPSNAMLDELAGALKPRDAARIASRVLPTAPVPPRSINGSRSGARKR